MIDKSLAVFENYNIRRIYDEESETWYFSVVDIIQALIQQPDYQAARNYWKVLKNRLNKEGSEAVTKCNRLKLVAEDGKMRLTDVARTLGTRELWGTLGTRNFGDVIAGLDLFFTWYNPTSSIL